MHTTTIGRTREARSHHPSATSAASGQPEVEIIIIIGRASLAQSRRPITATLFALQQCGMHISSNGRAKEERGCAARAREWSFGLERGLFALPPQDLPRMENVWCYFGGLTAEVRKMVRQETA